MKKIYKIVKKKLKRIRRRITYSNQFLSILSLLSIFLIFIYSKTLKIKYYTHPEIKSIDRSKVIYASWHGHLLLLTSFCQHFHTCLLTDLSWSAEIITRILEKLGYKVARGSSKRKGIRGLINMKNAFRDGWSGGITVDGPKGPRYKSKEGILFLSKKFSYPIIPLTGAAEKKWILNTWCRFLIPKPFSKCYIAFGKPVWNAIDTDNFLTEDLDKILLNWMHYWDNKKY